MSVLVLNFSQVGDIRFQLKLMVSALDSSYDRQSNRHVLLTLFLIGVFEDEIRNKWKQPVNKLPLAIDLPRLYRSIQFDVTGIYPICFCAKQCDRRLL